MQDLLFSGNAAQVKNSDFANGLQADASYSWAITTPSAPGCWQLMTSNSSIPRPLSFPSSSQFTASPTGDTIPAIGGPAPLPGNPPQSSTTPFTITANGGNSGLTAGLYLQDEWRLNDHLTLNYGLRYDRLRRFVRPRGANQSARQPGLADQQRHYRPHRLCALFHAAHVAIRSAVHVKAFEYTTDAPFNERDDPQKVERDHYFDAGLSRQITPAWQVTADSFCKLAKNLLDDGQFGSAVILNNFNYSSGTVYGAELSSTYKQGPFSAYGNFSYVQTWAQRHRLR